MLLSTTGRKKHGNPVIFYFKTSFFSPLSRLDVSLQTDVFLLTKKTTRCKLSKGPADDV